MRTDRSSFSAFVTAEHAALLALADLLESDERAAEDLVREALTSTRSRRRASSRSAADRTRAALLRRHLGRGGDGASGWVADADPWSPAGDPLRRALDELPPRTRAAAVLHLHEHRTDAEVARLLRCDEATVRTELAAGLPLLHAALGATTPSPGADDGLRRELALLAAPGRRPLLDAAGTAEVVVRTVSRRRRRRRVTGLAAVGAVAVAATVSLSGGAPITPAAEPGTDRPARPPAEVPVFAGPPRGPLAGDAAFVAAARELPWHNELTRDWPDAPTIVPGTARVVFAGDVPGGRWVLLAGEPELPPVEGAPGPVEDRPSADGGLITAWFTGPPGAAPADLRMRNFPALIGPLDPVALSDPATGTLVVVAAPGDELAVSLGPEVGADASVTREFAPVATEDGVAVVRGVAYDLPWSGAARFRVLRGGTEALRGMPETIYDDGAAEPPLLDVRRLRGARATDAEPSAVLPVLFELGLARDEVAIVLHWHGPLPTDHGTAEATLLTVELPSGAVAASAQWWSGDGRGGSHGAPCGMDLRPAGPPVEQRVWAARCEVVDWDDTAGSPPQALLLVVAPPSVASVRAWSGGGRFLEAFPAEDGVVTVPMPPETASVEAVTAGGVSLGRTDLLDPWLDLGD